MTDIGPPTVLAVFLLFCRIGACLMLMPGTSSTRVPVNVRLFLAFAVTLALAPLLVAPIQAAVTDLTLRTFAPLIVSELLIGAMIGLMARIFFLALQMLASAAAMGVGFGGLPGVAIEETEPVGPLVSLITLSAVLLLFITDQHWEILRGLAESYSALPIAQLFGPQFALAQVVGSLTDSFVLALRISSPFIIYAVIVNFAIGVANKLTPQIPIYFISLPFVLAGGLLLFYIIGPEMLQLFIGGFASWLALG
jgi:flagellar biosynthetic protein FliR